MSSHESPPKIHFESIITIHIEGIRSLPEPSIPLHSINDIEKSVSALRLLLSGYGRYELGEIPQFANDKLLLEVVGTHHDSPPFDAKRFDLCARNIVEFIVANKKRRTPTLTHHDHALAIDNINDICMSLKSLGLVIFQIGEMGVIELPNHARWRTDSSEHLSMIEVASASDVAGLILSQGELIVSDAKAKTFHPGDPITQDDAKDAIPIRRAVGSLVSIIDSTMAVTADMFSTGDHEKQTPG